MNSPYKSILNAVYNETAYKHRVFLLDKDVQSMSLKEITQRCRSMDRRWIRVGDRGDLSYVSYKKGERGKYKFIKASNGHLKYDDDTLSKLEEKFKIHETKK